MIISTFHEHVILGTSYLRFGTVILWIIVDEKAPVMKSSAMDNKSWIALKRMLNSSCNNKRDVHVFIILLD